MDATVQAVGVQAAAETPKEVSPIDGIIDAVAAAVISRLGLASMVKVQLFEMSRNLESAMRDMATEVVDQKISEAVGDDSSAMGEAMRKIAEDIFDEKIDDALENYDCSEAIQKALDDKDFESDMDDKIEKAFEEVDWAEELRNLRFRAV
jgi:hypothetical protein